MKNAAFLLFILFLCTGCNPDTNEIAGKVIDKSTETVIENVQVIIEGYDLKSETDSHGDYRLAGLPDSDYSIIYIHQNYDTLTVNANEMETGETYRIDVALNRRHHVQPKPL
jgi:hypothetical protein